MDDSSGNLVSAELDHLTKTGTRSVVMFGLFMLGLIFVVGSVLYVTATTADHFKKAWGVED